MFDPLRQLELVRRSSLRRCLELLEEALNLPTVLLILVEAGSSALRNME